VSLTAIASHRELFRRATGREPHPYQERLATASDLPSVLRAPTGSGKTQAVLLAWLHRRLFAEHHVREATPRRLVYTLPMRVLVDQVWRVVTDALDGLGLNEDQVGRHLLMGGQGRPASDWARHPERLAVLVGTVDMLLSRALNRGYAAGRSRWPVDFGLINADCLWVLDETQLMGVAVTTTAQLDGLREKLGTLRRCRTIWMSATVDARSLTTVDRPRVGEVFSLTPGDLTGDLATRLKARKQLEQRDTDVASIVAAEHAPGSMTLAVHNTVRAATDTARRLRKRGATGGPDVVLLHSRFRPPDRRRLTDELLAPVPTDGRVVCATQVIEAGVDISARLLITEVAPWSSVVQRLGRCNRRGELDAGLVRWVEPKRPEPYDPAALELARSVLRRLEGEDVSPWALFELRVDEPPPSPPAVLRRRDLLDLFDTAPDLSGSDLDVSRFVRDAEDVDCRVFWRTWDGEEPPADSSAPAPDELCPAPIGELRKLIDSGRHGFVWDALLSRWRRVRGRDLRPGIEVLLPAAAGGYSPETGWDPASKEPVEPVPGSGDKPEANWADPETQIGAWVDLATHTRDVEAEVAAISAAALDGSSPPEVADVLRLAARGHDVGKALERWQEALLAGVEPETERARRRTTIWAKSDRWSRATGRNPRHELVSILALLRSSWLAERLEEPWADLALYLVAAHHGKARVTIRPWPDEPDGQVLGVRDGDRLPAVDVGELCLPELELSLQPLRMGDGADGASWAARMLRLRDHPDLGPFRMAHLEALLRAADWRASEREERLGRA
jgi:CRISPR-associated endonuclease/helicase Cas3